jgi:hypothetical protein
LLVAIADSWWRGKRDDQLETAVSRWIAQETQEPQWQVFAALAISPPRSRQKPQRGWRGSGSLKRRRDLSRSAVAHPTPSFLASEPPGRLR